MRRDDNVYHYPPAVWERFAAPQFAGQLRGAGVSVLAARTPAARAEIELSVRLGAPRSARFRAYGCPYTIAVGEWLAALIEREAPPAWSRVDAAWIRDALEIPEERAHCAFMAEDILRSLMKDLQRDTR